MSSGAPGVPQRKKANLPVAPQQLALLTPLLPMRKS
jgi:hypothetical protein